LKPTPPTFSPPSSSDRKEWKLDRVRELVTAAAAAAAADAPITVSSSSSSGTLGSRGEDERLEEEERLELDKLLDVVFAPLLLLIMGETGEKSTMAPLVLGDDGVVLVVVVVLVGWLFGENATNDTAFGEEAFMSRECAGVVAVVDFSAEAVTEAPLPLPPLPCRSGLTNTPVESPCSSCCSASFSLGPPLLPNNPPPSPPNNLRPRFLAASIHHARTAIPQQEMASSTPAATAAAASLESRAPEVGEVRSESTGK